MLALGDNRRCANTRRDGNEFKGSLTSGGTLYDCGSHCPRKEYLFRLRLAKNVREHFFSLDLPMKICQFNIVLRSKTAHDHMELVDENNHTELIEATAWLSSSTES